MNIPLVSIGVPTYNRAVDLRKCLANLTSLEYKNIEIIISDNNSTDATVSVCREYLKKDKRIRYYRQPTTIAGEKNFAFVAGKATGKYFFVAADDDKRDKTYLSELIPLLERNQTATTAITDTTLFTKCQSSKIPVYFRHINHPIAAFYTYLFHPQCVSILLYGVHRRSQKFDDNYRRVMYEKRLLNIQGYDTSLAIFLLLRGDLLYIRKNMLYIRDNGMYLSKYQHLSDLKISKEFFQKSARYLLFPLMFIYDWYYGALHIYRSSQPFFIKPLLFISLTGKYLMDNIHFLYTILKAVYLVSLGLIRKITIPIRNISGK